LYIQDACFKKFLKQSFTFLVVDDSEDPSVAEVLKQICSHLQYTYARCPIPTGMNASSPSFRHAHALNYGWKVLLQTVNAKYVGTLDTDLIPVSPIDLEEQMRKIDVLAARLQNPEFTFFWPGLTLFKVGSQPLEEIRWDLFVKNREGSDTGGATSLYIESVSDTYSVRYFTWHAVRTEPDHVFIETINMFLPPSLIEFCKEDVKRLNKPGSQWIVDVFEHSTMLFFHLKNVSNWARNSTEYHHGRVQRFAQAIEGVLRS
jgi:hypothetical protein